MSRADTRETDRRDFFLYVDEFEKFATESFATILSKARKYRLTLTLANQFLTQMEDATADAVFGSVGSLVAFQVGARDAPTRWKPCRRPVHPASAIDPKPSVARPGSGTAGRWRRSKPKFSGHSPTRARSLVTYRLVSAALSAGLAASGLPSVFGELGLGVVVGGCPPLVMIQLLV